MSNDMDLKTMLEMINTTLDQSYDRIGNQQHRQRISNYLARLGGGVELVNVLKRLAESPESHDTLFGRGILCSVCWNYSDDSEKLCKQFAQAGLLEIMFGYLDKYGPNKALNEVRRRFFFFGILTVDSALPLLWLCSGELAEKVIRVAALSILYNCAKVDDDKEVFHKLNAVERITPFLNCDYLELNMDAVLMLSYIADPDHEVNLTAKEAVFSHILDVLKAAICEVTHRHLGYSVLEIIKGLEKIATDDNAKTLIVDNNAVPVLVDIMRHGISSEIENAADLLWLLSQVDRNKQIILDMSVAIETLHKLSMHSNTSVKESAGRTLTVLQSL
ncbi:uncharacterized protein LOC144357826 [Saccoglossus kowalevskii]